MVALPGGFTAIPEKPSAYECENPRTAFMDELASYGFEERVGQKLSATPELGKIVRVAASNDKKGKQSGWYWYSEFTDDFKPGALIGVGVFGNWKGHPEKVVWTSKRKDSMSPAESARLDEQMTAARIARELELEAKRKAAATKAQEIWAEATDAPADHPYLAAKGIQPHGTRISLGKIVVPVMEKGEIVSVQFIDAKGNKRFLGGGKTKGCHYAIGEPSGTVYVAEGFSTGATIHEATGDRVYVAYNAGNLLEATSAAKDENPDAHIIIAGDDDHKTDGNPGRSKADAAGDVLHCKVIYPEVEGDDTDFNDMARREGINSVRKLLKGRSLEELAVAYQKSPSAPEFPAHCLDIDGPFGEICNWMNETSVIRQPILTIMATLATLGAVFGRRYAALPYETRTKILIIAIALTGGGKDHHRKCLKKLLSYAGCEYLLMGGRV